MTKNDFIIDTAHQVVLILLYHLSLCNSNLITVFSFTVFLSHWFFYTHNNSFLSSSYLHVTRTFYWIYLWFTLTLTYRSSDPIITLYLCTIGPLITCLWVRTCEPLLVPTIFRALVPKLYTPRTSFVWPLTSTLIFSDGVGEQAVTRIDLYTYTLILPSS